MDHFRANRCNGPCTVSLHSPPSAAYIVAGSGRKRRGGGATWKRHVRADMCNDENPTASRSNRHLAIKVTGVWKVYFLHTPALPSHAGQLFSQLSCAYRLHTPALPSHAGQLFSQLSCAYRCHNHRADSVQRRRLLARLRSRRMQGKMYIR